MTFVCFLLHALEIVIAFENIVLFPSYPANLPVLAAATKN
jgi:hypothetical protein